MCNKCNYPNYPWKKYLTSGLVIRFHFLNSGLVKNRIRNPFKFFTLSVSLFKAWKSRVFCIPFSSIESPLRNQNTLLPF